jgi:YesN/AraC family two-component response regulator
MKSPEGFGIARVLICEDEPLAVRALREYLKDVDWIEVVGDARNGSEAIRLIQKLEPDLIFLDVRMPGMSGLEVLETITHHTPQSSSPPHTTSTPSRLSSSEPSIIS